MQSNVSVTVRPDPVMLSPRLDECLEGVVVELRLEQVYPFAHAQLEITAYFFGFAPPVFEVGVTRATARPHRRAVDRLREAGSKNLLDVPAALPRHDLRRDVGQPALT